LYKYLLCWRYLRTRYIALASVISVMLGVATMIVVNSVMAGFSEKMRDRLHGILADVVVESGSLEGFMNSEEVMARIRQVAGDQVLALTPTLETPGIIKIPFGNQSYVRPVQIIGVDPVERAKTGDFAEFLFDEAGKPIPPSFEVSDELRIRSSSVGTLIREAEAQAAQAPAESPAEALDPSEPAGPTEGTATDRQYLAMLKQKALEQVPAKGAILGYALATIHQGNGKGDVFIAPTGASVGLVFPKAGRKGPEAGGDAFPVIGFFKSGMSEYDSQHVYVPLRELQKARALFDPATGRGAVNQIQIKAQPGCDIDKMAETIQVALDRLQPMAFRVRTWEQLQGPLLAAVTIEQSILNILLFFIIAVAGFGILAIFSMIVVEKTRDIGIMKALGASTSGIRGIFLGYGLLLGAVGSGVGMVGGLLFVHYINEIEGWLSKILHHKVFDDSIYYFASIPTLVNPFTVAWIVAGAMFIAVAASVWPAQRASRLHPVRALRYE
jgi:lipoprotein-releasing system permease protein